ncbi:hypothetical protein ACA910_009653 [Epithemia clementina (nom. ined.)]
MPKPDRVEIGKHVVTKKAFVPVHPWALPVCWETLVPLLFPNPLFEEFTSCPTGVTQLDRAVTWIQATDATSDYWVGSPTCDDASWRNGLGRIGAIPQKATDGDAFVGSVKLALELWYEYIGACLLSPLEIGKEYTFTQDIAAASDSNLYGGDKNGLTELLCIPDCNKFRIVGNGYMGDTFEILAMAEPVGGLVGGRQR